MNSDQEVAEIISRIQVYCYPRRLRVREFFQDFDGLRCGRCTRIQFGRAITMLGVSISDKESLMLAEYYTQTGPNIEKPQIVNYYRFCSDIDEVYANDGVSAEQGHFIEMSSSPGSTMISSFFPQSDEDESRVFHVLHRVAALCKTRGIILAKCFEDFHQSANPSPARMNPYSGGKCTRMQFIRNFPFTKDFGEAELKIILDRYSTAKGDIHFMALHNDVSEVMSTEMQPVPSSPLIVRPDNTEWSHSKLSPVDKLKAKVVEKRLRMLEQFRDFDPLRKGVCTVGQLKAVLTILCLAKEINKKEFDTLTFAYMNDCGLFCYKDFCADVDRAFTIPHLEKDPLLEVSMPDATTTSPARRNTVTLNQDRKSKVAKLEDKIRTKVQKRKMLIKPTFCDFDKATRGFITLNEFHRAMQMLTFYDLTPEDVELLGGVYCNLGTKLDFNYRDFCRSVDCGDPDCQLAEEQSQLPYQKFQPAKYFDDDGKVQPYQPECGFGH